MNSSLYEELERIGLSVLGSWVERADRVVLPSGVTAKLRLWLVPGGFVDVFAAPSGRFAFHLEGREEGLGVYRHDNAPHGSEAACATWPRHCHVGREERVVESDLPADLPAAFEAYCVLLLEFLGGRR